MGNKKSFFLLVSEFSFVCGGGFVCVCVSVRGCYFVLSYFGVMELVYIVDGGFGF